MLSRIKEKFFGVQTVHDDVRIYLDIIQKRGLDDIHYGYWKGNDESFKRAQEQLSEVAISLLPSPPSSVLDVGGRNRRVLKLFDEEGLLQYLSCPRRKPHHLWERKIPRRNFSTRECGVIYDTQKI